MSKDRAIGNGLDLLGKQSPGETVLSAEHTCSVCPACFQGPLYLEITWARVEDWCPERCPEEVHRENGVHCVALYPSQGVTLFQLRKDASNPLGNRLSM